MLWEWKWVLGLLNGVGGHFHLELLIDPQPSPSDGALQCFPRPWDGIMEPFGLISHFQELPSPSTFFSLLSFHSWWWLQPCSITALLTPGLHTVGPTKSCFGSCHFPAQKPMKISYLPQHHILTCFSRPSSNWINLTYSTFHLHIPLTVSHAKPPLPIITSLPFFSLFPLPGIPFLDPCILKLCPSCTFRVHLTDLLLFELFKHYKCLLYAL